MGILSPGADCISNLISLKLWIYQNVPIKKQDAKNKQKNSTPKRAPIQMTAGKRKSTCILIGISLP